MYPMLVGTFHGFNEIKRNNDFDSTVILSSYFGI